MGSSVECNVTKFKLWAPTANRVVLKISNRSYEMQRIDNGVWYFEINRNCHGEVYNYIVYVNGQASEVIDPYAKASIANSASSVVIDIARIINRVDRLALNSNDRTQSNVIYELSVYDFSNEKYHKNKGNLYHLLRKSVNKFGQPWYDY